MGPYAAESIINTDNDMESSGLTTSCPFRLHVWETQKFGKTTFVCFLIKNTFESCNSEKAFQ